MVSLKTLVNKVIRFRCKMMGADCVNAHNLNEAARIPVRRNLRWGIKSYQ